MQFETSSIEMSMFTLLSATHFLKNLLKSLNCYFFLLLCPFMVIHFYSFYFHFRGSPQERNDVVHFSEFNKKLYPLLLVSKLTLQSALKFTNVLLHTSYCLILINIERKAGQISKLSLY